MKTTPVLTRFFSFSDEQTFGFRRGNASRSPDNSFFPGEDISVLRQHVAEADAEHYTTYRARCRAAGVKPNPQCSPDGVILDDDTDERPDRLQLHKSFEKAMLLTHFMALVSCTAEMVHLTFYLLTLTLTLFSFRPLIKSLFHHFANFSSSAAMI